MKLVRIEYEIPPLRAIYQTYFEDKPEFDEQTYRNAFAESFPRGQIRKIERGVESEAGGKGGL